MTKDGGFFGFYEVGRHFEVALETCRSGVLRTTYRLLSGYFCSGFILEEFS